MEVHEKLDNIRLELDEKVERLEDRVRSLELQVGRFKGYLAAVIAIASIIGSLLSMLKFKIFFGG